MDHEFQFLHDNSSVIQNIFKIITDLDLKYNEM